MEMDFMKILREAIAVNIVKRKIATDEVLRREEIIELDKRYIRK